jgi:hypothetical protein
VRRNRVGAKQIKNNAVAADFRAGQLPQGPKGATTRVFTCVLQAGSDYDTSATRLQLDGTNNVTHAAIPLQVVHTTTSPFSATVTCAYDGGASLVVQAHDVNITAIRVANLTSAAVTG